MGGAGGMKKEIEKTHLLTLDFRRQSPQQWGEIKVQMVHLTKCSTIVTDTHTDGGVEGGGGTPSVCLPLKSNTGKLGRLSACVCV